MKTEVIENREETVQKEDQQQKWIHFFEVILSMMFTAALVGLKSQKSFSLFFKDFLPCLRRERTHRQQFLCPGFPSLQQADLSSVIQESRCRAKVEISSFPQLIDSSQLSIDRKSCAVGSWSLASFPVVWDAPNPPQIHAFKPGWCLDHLHWALFCCMLEIAAPTCSCGQGHLPLKNFIFSMEARVKVILNSKSPSWTPVLRKAPPEVLFSQ